MRVALCDDYGVYPSSFPFESDSTLPPMTKATPSYVFTAPDSDPGGYMAQIFSSTATFNKYSAPPFLLYNFGYLDYWYYQKRGQIVSDREGFVPRKINYNCTGRYMLDQNFFPGTMGASKIACATETCCQSYLGHWTYTSLTGVLEYDATVDQINSLGGCPEAWSEVMYCAGTTNVFQCSSNIISRSQRIIVGPCFDLYIKYYMKCPLYAVTGVWRSTIEPSTYVSKGTPVDSFYIFALVIQFSADRVCYPSSYYSPQNVPSDAKSIGSFYLDFIPAFLIMLFV